MLIFKRITGYLKLLAKLNISKTIYFNFKVLPWDQAVKFPVFLFGATDLKDLSGKIQIRSEISRGMIQFGNNEENIISTREPTRISVSGSLIFMGTCKFSKSVQLLVWNNGSLEIGTNAWFGTFVKLVAFENIKIAKNFMASWECQIFDTDFHFIKNNISNNIENNTRPVAIGENVWLGSRVSILKGTVLPDKCIVATGSICNKDFSEFGSKGIVIGGTPAKIIKENVEYIYDKKLEKKLFEYFQQNGKFQQLYKTQ